MKSWSALGLFLFLAGAASWGAQEGGDEYVENADVTYGHSIYRDWAIDMVSQWKVFELDDISDTEERRHQYCKNYLSLPGAAAPRFRGCIFPIYRKFAKIPGAYAPAVAEGASFVCQLPDPDRWFFASFLLQHEFKLVSPEELVKILPKSIAYQVRWILSYKKGRTVYLNGEAFHGKYSRGDTITDGISILMLWLPVKAWLDPESISYSRAAKYLLHTVQTLKLESFRIRDSRGFFPLRYLNQLEAIQAAIQPLDSDQVALDRTLYRGENRKHSFELFTAGPIRYTNAAGEMTGSKSYQFKNAEMSYCNDPDSLVARPWKTPEGSQAGSLSALPLSISYEGAAPEIKVGSLKTFLNITPAATSTEVAASIEKQFTEKKFNAR